MCSCRCLFFYVQLQIKRTFFLNSFAKILAWDPNQTIYCKYASLVPHVYVSELTVQLKTEQHICRDLKKQMHQINSVNIRGKSEEI